MRFCFLHVNLNHFLALAAIFICLAGTSLAQEQKVVRDLNLWTEIKLEKEIVNDLKLSVSQHLRFYRNVSGFDDYISEAGLEYKINRNFEMGAVGRYTFNNHYDELAENDYRYDLYLGFDTKLSEKIKFYARLKYQKEFYGSGVFNRFLNYYETAYRYRVKISWEKNESHRFYTSAEIFRLIKKSREPFWDKFRIWAGDDVSSGFGNFDLAFGVQHELNSRNPYTYYIFKIQYEIEL